MSRILLVSSNTTIDPFPVYPLGMAVVASALASAGHTVDQFDFLMEGESEDVFRNRIKGFEPDFVCMSLRNLDNCDSLTATAYPVVAKRLVELVREVWAVPVIVGGPAFSILPEELLAFTGADYGIVGEGERLVCELIQELSQGRTSPRILRNQGLISGQDMISPLYSADMVSYYVEQSGMINLQSKRGCAHGCIYCSYPSLEGKRYRLREPGAVVDDMERAKQEHGVDTFFFTDAVFNDDGGHYLQVVEEILRRDSAFRWACYVRPEGIGRNEVSLMKRAGMYAAELGTDAACDRTLRGIGKGFKFADALEVNRIFVAERVPCAHFVMFGGPGETLETIEEGLANLELLENTVVFAFTGLRILPDTPLHTLAIQEGVLAKDAPLHEPAFYHSPQVDRAVMDAMISNSFQGRRDRFFPPETSHRVRTVMSRFGYKGLLWDSIIRFPKIPVLPST